MAYYLQMDGTKDLLITPSITFTKVEIDLYVENTVGKAQTYFDARSNNLLAYLSRDVNNLEIWLILVLNVAVNGVAKLPSNNIIPSKTRQTVTINMLLPAKDSVTIFARKNKTEHVKGRIYGARFYNNNTMVANYDMQTRTLQDQTGNGNHATAEGGTWATDTPSIVESGDISGSCQTNGIAGSYVRKSGIAVATSETSIAATPKRTLFAQGTGGINSNASSLAVKRIASESIAASTSYGLLETDKYTHGEAVGESGTSGMTVAKKVSKGTSTGNSQTSVLTGSSKIMVASIAGESINNGLSIPSIIANGSATGNMLTSNQTMASQVVKGDVVNEVQTDSYSLANKILSSSASSQNVTGAIGEVNVSFGGEGIGAVISNGRAAGDINYYAKTIKGEVLIIRKQSGELKTIRKLASEVIL